MLTKWLNETSVETFFEEFWGTRYLQYKKNNDLTIPFDLSKFERILFSYPFHYPQLKVFEDGGTVDLRLYTESDHKGLRSKISHEKLVQNHLLSGKTIVMNNVQTLDHEMDEFHRHLENTFGCKININAYYSHGPTKGANAHYDLHHIFAVQLHGQKDWSIGPIVVESPTSDFAPAVTESVPFDTHLSVEEQEILYMPPGMWHTVETPDVSLHLTIGVQQPNWYSVMKQMLDQAMKEHFILRSSIPFSVSEDRCVYENDLSYGIEKLFELVQAEMPEHNHLLGPADQPIRFLSKGNIFSKTDLEFHDPHIKEALNDLWSMLPQPISMYTRGSFLNEKALHSPWDLDIILVHKGKAPYTKLEISNFIHEKYPDIPTIDLKVIPLEELQDDKWLLVRLLLQSKQSKCLYGKVLSKDLMSVDINDQTIAILRHQFLTNLESKLHSFVRKKDFITADETWTRARTVAKGVLRCIGLETLKEKEQLLREPEACKQLIQQRYPDLTSQTETMMSMIRQQDVDYDVFIEDAQLLLKRLLHDEIQS